MLAERGGVLRVGGALRRRAAEGSGRAGGGGATLGGPPWRRVGVPGQRAAEAGAPALPGVPLRPVSRQPVLGRAVSLLCGPMGRGGARPLRDRSQVSRAL